MTKQEQMKECRDALTKGMERVGFNREEIWQNDLIWWMCKALLLLLEKAIKGEK